MVQTDNIKITEDLHDKRPVKERPAGLTALCILSFTGSGIALVVHLLSSIFFQEASSFIIRYSSWYSVADISPLYFGVLSFVHALSFAGVFQIWKLRVTGLYIYTIAQLVQLFLPSLWINFQAFSVSNAIFTGVFLAGYLVYSGKLFRLSAQ